ncbi:DUF2911 domain-containing protein [Cochleicola gelatinilyticus]|uniref:Asparagine synthetase B n=1 Tax=Cochleicola gelatinilyticus TaxID=1763537 RepID=A0A167IDJ9_9FLAO|nr:DUF2911 domain-containing protein [Cochleicola gelatinilyticus]OAB79547.1 asparagine synthetase B [Cochleicola gelatinilyticus]
MKTRNLLATTTMAFLLLFTIQINAQEFKDLDKSPMDVAAFPSDYKDANKLIKIQYSRPQLKGRTLQKLAPNGEVWRTGANEAAELTLYADMMLGDTKVKAGTYTFYVIPGAKEWTAIVSTDLNVWGSYFYKEGNDVARITVPVTEDNKALEAFSIAFDKSDDGVDMHLGWGTTRVKVPFTSAKMDTMKMKK